jgi:hypothetical protein
MPPMPAGPADFARSLKELAKLEPGSPVYLAWEAGMSGGAALDPALAESAATVRAAGGTPWISLVFTSPPPLAQAGDRLQGELRAAAAFAAKVPAGTWIQIVWRPELGGFSPVEYAFLLKRAAVAVTGAQGGAQVATEPLPLDPAAIAAFYGEEVAAYLEAVVLPPVPPGGEAGFAAAIAAITQADPGRAVVVDGEPLPGGAGGVAADAAPAPAEILMAAAARNAARGVALTLFQAPATDLKGLLPALAPLTVLAREFRGDLSYEAGAAPQGAEEAWAFVQGRDLSLRVIALAPADAKTLTLRFADPALRRPIRYPVSSRRVVPPTGKVTAQGLNLDLADPGRVVVVGLERASAEELKGVSQKITVAGEREMPVEEILRRLQAFEDAQGRKLEHYQALNTTHLRFQPSAGAQTFEATLEGPFFWNPKTGADWAWQTLYVNGVKWRGKTLPEIPLLQPEKAAALPLQILFTKQYRYRLRGSDRVGDRDAWVVDFAPAGADESGKAGKLYQGSVWVDKQIYSRLKTRAVQIGLEGEVLSNEETFTYTPIDAHGQPAPWSGDSFVLPLHLVAQQILSVVNASTVVERETLLTHVQINDEGFETARKAIEDTPVTMVRDTDKGLRYLVKPPDGGERVVKEGFDHDKLFLLGGVFYDDALDYPLPLAGINYLSFDFKGTGQQLNTFFAGALLTVNVANPRAFGTRFDLGADLFALAVPFTDTFFRDNKEDRNEEIKARAASLGLKAGHPIGNFLKLNFEYDLLRFDYKTTKNTAADFALPANNFTHSVELGGSFSRSGYGFRAHGSYNRRSQWDAWGQPGNTDFDPDKKDFLRWDARASKNWYLSKFRKVGFEVDYVSGSDLDRFSKYQFGFFGDTRVHGYQSNRVRASKALASHLSYGFEIGQAFRLEAVGDAAWATDKETGLKNELLAGAGIQGTFIGPWQTVVNMDVGVPVAGPDNGFVAYIVFLKLFH